MTVIVVTPQTTTVEETSTILSTTTTSIFNTITVTAAPTDGIDVNFVAVTIIISIFILLLVTIFALFLLHKRRMGKHKNQRCEQRLKNIAQI
jgi:uncharacterized membrane protein (DUF106 family)